MVDKLHLDEDIRPIIVPDVTNFRNLMALMSSARRCDNKYDAHIGDHAILGTRFKAPQILDLDL